MLRCRAASSLPRLGAASLLRLGRRTMSTAPTWTEARFGGATVHLGENPSLESLESQLGAVVKELREVGRRGVWMSVPIAQAGAIPAAAAHGFKFHHAEGDKAMLLNWLPEDVPSPVPDFATTVIGAGGLTLNARNEVLVIKEARAPNPRVQGSWKLPGGLLDLGEELRDGVVREVREETGVEASFRSLLAMRHQHGAAFGRGDIYAVCLLEPLTEEIIPDAVGEVSECRWLPLPEYVEAVKATSERQGVKENLNYFVARNVLRAVERGELDTVGFACSEHETPGGSLQPGVTGLTNKKTTLFYTPPSFEKLSD